MADEKDDSQSAEEVLEEMSEAGEDADVESDAAADEESSDGDSEGEAAGTDGESGEEETEEASGESGGGDESDDETDGESESAESEETAEDGDESESADLVDKMAESEKLEGVSKDEIKEALSEVAGDADDDDLAAAIAAAAADEESTDEESTDEESTEEEESAEEEGADEEGADEEAAEEESADEESEQEAAEEEEPEEEESAEEPGEAEEEAPAPEPAAAAAEEGTVGGVFTPDRTAEEEKSGGYLDDDDLDEYESEESHMGVLMAGGGAVVVLTIALVILFGFTKQGERLVHLFKGDLKEYELAESKKTQAMLREKQRDIIDKTPKIGTLKMRGKPQYALIRVDGEIQYGKPKDADYWKRMRLTPKTSFPVFNVEKDHKVTVTAPGHKKRVIDLALGNWTPLDDSVPDLQDAALKYNNEISITMVPNSRARELEFHKRMEKDPENNYFGTVTIETKPEGAKIMFDGAPLRDKEGEKLTTPVTFEKFYVEKEDSDELKEKKVKVDMPPDRGHKIQLEVPKAKGDYPKFVSGLQRQMWTCKWKEGEVPDNPSPKKCNYEFKLNVDFEKVKSFIENRKKKREEIKAAWKKAQDEIDAIVRKANKKAGVSGKKGKKKGGEKGGESTK